MKNIPYASTVGNLMYAQVCTRPDIAYAIGVLGRYQSNPGMNHLRVAKKVMRYLQGTKYYMLMYRQTDNLDLVGYLMQTLLAVLILINQHLSTFSSWPVELFLGEVSNKL